MRALLLVPYLLLVATPARADTWQATYDAYVAGANAVRLTAAINIGPSAYRMDVQARTLGVLDLFVGSRQSTQVDGVWLGRDPRPRAYRAEGLWKGERRATLIDYNEDMPTVRALVPVEAQREPVPTGARKGALDRLSPLAFLARQIGQSGRCDGMAMTFDGRRLEENRARTGGWDELAANRLSVFAGRALRCDIELRLIAGFAADEDRAHAGRVRHAQVWVAAPVANAPVLPVRLMMDTGWLGHIVVHLSDLRRAVP